MTRLVVLSSRTPLPYFRISIDLFDDLCLVRMSGLGSNRFESDLKYFISKLRLKDWKS